MISSMIVVFLTLLVIAVRCDQECSFRSDGETGYKASWVYDAQNKRVQFSIEAKQRLADNSWTGIGFGRTMKNGDMLIIANSGGRLSISDRHGSPAGYAEPLIDSQQDAQSFVGRMENGILYATFSRLVNTNDRDDKPLEDPTLNDCQFFMFPTTGGSTNANADPSKVVLEQHITTPITKLICNISRCTGGGEGQSTTPGAGPALSNNIQEEVLARDAVITNRSQSQRPGQAGAGGAITTPASANAGGQSSPQGGVTPPSAGGAQAGSTPAGEAALPGIRTSPPSVNGPNAAAGGDEAAPGAGSACEYEDGKYKVQWYYTEATKRLTFSLSAPLQPSRWTGIGFGQQMQNGDMIIIQDNNGVKVTDRHGIGHVEPVLDSHQDIEAFKGVINGGILQASFNRLLNTNDKEDLAIDDEAQNNCQYFIFPISGGNVDEQGKLQLHDSTPKVKLICNAKTCKKPADAAAAGAGAAESAEEPQGSSTPSAGAGIGETGTTGLGGIGAAGGSGAAGGIGGSGGSGGIGASSNTTSNAQGGNIAPSGVTPGIGAAGQGQPGSTGAGENPIAGGTTGIPNQAAGGQTTTTGAQSIGGQPGGGQQASGQPGGGLSTIGQAAGGQQGSGQPGAGIGGGQNGGQAAGGNQGQGEAGGANGASTQGQAGSEGEAAGGPGAATRQCPARKDHHLCTQYVDDYLSVVYSRFPKTDVITQKACGLLATTQEGVVLRECCHYLASQCGRFIDQFIGGLSATASGNSGPSVGSILSATSTIAPIGGSNNGAAGIAGRGGPTASVSTPAPETENPAAPDNNPVIGQASTPNPNQPIGGTAPNSSPNPQAGQNANPALTPNRNPSPGAADRAPEIQPASPSANGANAPNPVSASAGAPNAQEAKSGNGIPPSSAAKPPLPNDASQPDAAGKPGGRR